MKKYLSLLLVLLLLTGCGGPAPTPTAPPPPEPLPEPVPATEAVTEPFTEPAIPQELAADADVIVHTVDELIAALGNDKTILLAPGYYDLTSASTYGGDTGNPSCHWYADEYMDGWQLVLQDVYGTVIRGCGQDSTFLLTVPRLANVLSLNGCSDLTLEGFTAGHVDGGEPCTGGVIDLNTTGEIRLRDLGLYGCGIVGVNLYESHGVTVSGCDIYDCSAQGITGLFSSRITVEDCRIHDIGGERPAFSLLSFDSCDDLTFTDTTFENSWSHGLLEFTFCGNTVFENCTFTGNRVLDTAFRFLDVEPVLDRCSFEGNEIAEWYAPNSLMACSAEGVSLYPEIFPVFDPTQEDLPPQKPVHVKNAEEFLSAIAPDTEIILDAPVYDLTDAFFEAEPTCPVYYWEYDSMDHTLFIRDVDNFSITGSADCTAHRILTSSIYADVLSFENCNNITLSGFTAGHDVDPGTCSGDVLSFRDVNGLRILNCGLYGCGVIGVNADYCRNVLIEACDIYECSSYGVAFSNVRGANLNGNTFRDLGSSPVILWDSRDVLVDGVPDPRSE